MKLATCLGFGLIFAFVLHQTACRTLVKRQSMPYAAERECRRDHLENTNNFFDDETTKQRNYLACIWQKGGIIDANGYVSAEGFRSFLDKLLGEGPSRLKDSVIGMCKDVHGHTVGHTAVQLKDCMTYYLTSNM